MRLSLLCLATLSACQCSPPLATDLGDVHLPERLELGVAALGAPVGAALEVSSTARGARELTFRVDAPFAVQPGQLRLGGGAAEVVRVTFTPGQLGPVEGVLEVTVDGARRTVQLAGTGVEACRAAPCQAVRFDEASRRCVEAPLDDGAACETACLSAGQCRGGRCEGTFAGCDDGDPCTVDGCGEDGGCVRWPRECPVLDACRAAYCDPAVGCAEAPVDDGVSCGPATCEEARICLNGACVTRARPNAALDCRYTSVAAGDHHSCALTRGGQVRCWGLNLGQPGAPGATGRESQNLLTGPGFLPGVSAAAQIAGGDARTLVRQGGGVLRFGLGSLPDAGGLAVTWVASAGQTCLTLAGGTGRCLDSVSVDWAVPAGGIHRVVPMDDTTVLVWYLDGGVDEAALDAVDVPTLGAINVFDGPALDVTETGCALLAGGAVQCRSRAPASTVTVADAGVTALGGTTRYFGDPSVCLAFDAGRVDCLGLKLPGSVVVPGGVVALTSGGTRHVCALTGDGTVACWGANRRGELGDRSPQPAGILTVAAPPAASIAVRVDATLLGVDGGLWGWGRGFLRDLSGALLPNDGGAATPPTSLGPCATPEALGTTDNGGGCLLHAGAVSCWGEPSAAGGTPLTPIPHLAGAQWLGTCEYASATYPCVIDAAGTLQIVKYTQGATDVSQAAGPCWLRTDAGVSCLNRSSVPTPVPLGAAALTLSASCAGLATGGTRCWTVDAMTGAFTLRDIAGVLPFPRQLVSNGYLNGCALVGTSAVQCWGDNFVGELARDGQGSASAVTLPMPEPVQALAQDPSGAVTCALLRSGRVQCWGDNQAGQLGTPPLLFSATPVLVRE